MNVSSDNFTTNLTAPAHVAVSFNATMPGLVIIQLIKLLLTSMNVGMHCLILEALRLHRSQHLNLRLLLGNVSLSAIIWNLSNFCRCVYYFVVLTVKLPFRMRFYDCVLISVFESLSLRVSSLSIVFVGIERLIATKIHRNYEHRYFAIGVCLAVISWAQSVIWTVEGFRTLPTTFVSYVVEFCGNIIGGNLDNVMTWANIGYLVGCTFSSLLIYAAVYKLNRRLRKSFTANTLELSLSSRMQLKHSIEITRAMTGCVVAHALIRGSNQAYAILIIVFGTRFDYAIQLQLSLLTDVTIAFWFLVHGALFVWNSTKFQEKMFAQLPMFHRIWARIRRSHQKTTKVDRVLYELTEKEEKYFRQLSEFWGHGLGSQVKQTSV